MRLRSVDPQGIVPLTQGMVARVSPNDVALVSKYNWIAARTKGGLIYAQTTIPAAAGHRTILKMHRLILGAPPGSEVDHENGDGLDNRRENIRLASRGQNCQNRRPRACLSSFKGVWAAGRRWRAEIKAGENRRYLGVYATAEEAARVYDRAARALFGDFAHTNFPEETIP